MSKKLKTLCTSKNGMRVVYDPLSSHTATHFYDAPELSKLAIELLSTLQLEGDVIAKDFDMGRAIGNSDVVEVDETDEIVYAMRKHREDQGYVPFTKSRSTQPSTHISVYLVRVSDTEYELSSIWIGEFDSPNFPQMSNATPESIPYWTNHAFVWGSQEIIPGTERSDRPW